LQMIVLTTAVVAVGVLLGFVFGRSGHDEGGSTANPRAITVNGSGKVSSVPDEADFALGVSANAKTAKAATSANAELMTKVIAALKSKGVDSADIQTSQVSIYPNTSPNGSTVLGYTVTNSVNVTIRNLDQAGATIDAAVNVGANQVSGPTLTPSGQEKLYRDALQAAIADARLRAEAIATAAHRKLGALRSASETSSSPIAFASAKDSTAGGAPTPIEPGKVETDANVTATFDLG